MLFLVKEAWNVYDQTKKKNMRKSVHYAWHLKLKCAHMSKTISNE